MFGNIDTHVASRDSSLLYDIQIIFCLQSSFESPILIVSVLEMLPDDVAACHFWRPGPNSSEDFVT
jgi:hypothetical protein